jgi:large subunit ribosomal protein L11
MQGFLPVDIYILEGGKYNIKIHQERTSDLIRKELGLEKGATSPGRQEFNSINTEQLKKIAKYKLPDLMVNDEFAAIKTIAGTARSMGIKVVS